MYNIGLSTCGGKELESDFLMNCRKSGITALEISCSPERIFSFDYKDFIQRANGEGIKVTSFHLPFQPFETVDISSLDDKIRKNTVEYLERIIYKFSGYGINRFVLHSSGEPVEDTERRDRLECAKMSLSRLVNTAAQSGSTLAVEDLPRSCIGRNSQEIKELVSVDDRLKVCFDTNHLLAEYFEDFIMNVGDRIVTMHVSDYDFVNERHWLPGEGKVDWQNLLACLKRVGYNGPWLYEIHFKCPTSIIRDRLLTCEDFVKNAGEIFENKPLTVISKPKENLGFWG